MFSNRGPQKQGDKFNQCYCASLLTNLICCKINLLPAVKMVNRGVVFGCTGLTKHDFNLLVVSKFLIPRVMAHRHH